MKIIKRNESFGLFPMKITCERVVDEYGFSYGSINDFCGSELEIEIGDVKAHDWEKYPNLHGTDYGVVCPVCHRFIALNPTHLPALIKEKAEKIRLNT